jgi:predicted PurR-regulated permease PerM
MARSPSVKYATSRLVQIAAAIVIIFSLRYAKEVLIPIALAVLFAFLLAPLVHRLEKLKLGRVPSVLVVVLLAFGILGSIGVVVGGQLRDLSGHLPQYIETFEKGIKRMQSHGGWLSKLSQAANRISQDMSTKPATAPTAASATQPAAVSPLTGQPEAGDKVVEVHIASPDRPALDLLYGTFGPILEVLATAFIVVVLCVFMLVGREDLRDRLIRLVSHGQLNVTTQAMDDAATRVSRYLLMQALINGTYAVLVSVGLYFIHVPTPLLWGLLAGLLRFLPYVGPWLGASVPVLLAFLTLGAGRGFATMAMYGSLELVVSSFAEPYLYGSRTGVSSIAILVAAAFWSWVWGTVGLLLATPLTVLLVVVGKYVPQLEFLSVLLGDEPVFDPPTRYYQRLLASDQEEASELVEEFLEELPLEQVYENVLIPALGLAHRDQFRGRLDPERAEFIRASMKEEIEEFGERPPLEPKKPSPSAETTSLANPNAPVAPAAPGTKMVGAETVQVLCLPARDEADEIAGMMFAQVLERHGFMAEAVSVTALASEMVELVGQKKADLVVISALPPSAVGHARYLCKRLHQKYPDIKLVIGLWTIKADLDKARGRISCGTDDPVVSTFSDAIHEIEQLTHPLLLAKSEAESAENQKKDLERAERLATPSRVGAAAEARG